MDNRSITALIRATKKLLKKPGKKVAVKREKNEILRPIIAIIIAFCKRVIGLLFL